MPGPVAYRRGGTEPTVTDANVVLGRINPDSRMNGDGTSLDVAGARAAVQRLGTQMNLGLEQTAEAVLAVVNQRMAGRMRLMSIERGLDPRDFALVAFGGAGPLHGGALIREVGVSTMLVPLYPGVLCALGCVYADLRYDLSQTIEKRTDRLAANELAEIMARQRQQGQKQLDESQVPIDHASLTHAADMAYAGQIHSLRVPIQADWTPAQMEQAFVQTYQDKFGNTLQGMAVVVVNLRTIVVGTRASIAMPTMTAVASGSQPQASGRRPVYFGGWHDTPVYSRDALAPGMAFEGPAIVEQSDTTTVIEPDMTATVDVHGNLLVKVK
jgi:N-methylhydantoinase A